MEGLLDGAKELFGYNRENFFFDREMRLKREFQEQKMRIKQFLLYREDVRILTELTVSKMDSYLLVALVELGASLTLLCHGGIKGDHDYPPPAWLLWLYMVSLAEAFLYLFLSAWLAIHASVSANSFTVRMLTQFVRLPLPNKSQLDAASAFATDFEALGAGEFFRVPVLKQQAQRLAELDPPGGSSQPSAQPQAAAGVADLPAAPPPPPRPAAAAEVANLKHIQVYRSLQSNWQAHDAYSRTCLTLGTFTLLHSVAYYSIGMFLVELRSPMPALGCVVVLQVLMWMLEVLDVFFRSPVSVVFSAMQMSGPLLAGVAITFQLGEKGKFPKFCQDAHTVIVPVIFVMHALLIFNIILLARGEKVTDDSGAPTAALPTRFRAVLYLDVFGDLLPGASSASMRRQRSRQQRRREPAAAPGNATPGGAAARAGCRTRMPSLLRQQTCTECQRLGQTLDIELRAWESAKSAGHVTELPEAVVLCQRQFRALPAELQGGGQASSVAPQSLWLRLAFQPTPQSLVEYFVDSDTGEHRREPQDGMLVSDPSDVTGRLAELVERLEALAKTEESSEAQRTETTEQTQAEARASGAQEMNFGGRESAVTHDPRVAQGYDHSQRAAQTFFPRRDGVAESSRPPGKVPWATFRASTSMMVVVWLVGAAYWIITPLEELGKKLEKGHGERTEPGLHLLPPLSGARLEQSAASIAGARGRPPRRGLPQRPLGLACSASADGHPVAFIAERFGVQSAPLGVSVEGKVAEGAGAEDEVERCLAAHPSFLGGGLAGVHAECSEGAADGCSLVLLGADGSRALRCAPAGGPGEVVQLAPSGRSTGAGGWAALAVPPRRGGRESRWWALAAGADAAAEGQLARLRVRRGREGSLRASAQPGSPRRPRGRPAAAAWLLPGPEPPPPSGTNATARWLRGWAAAAGRQARPRAPAGALRALHADAGGLLLGLLGSDGRTLQAWTLGDGAGALSGPGAADGGLQEDMAWESAGAWRLPASHEWAGVCALGHHVYAVGTPSGGGSGAEVWRFDRPRSLQGEAQSGPVRGAAPPALQVVA